MCFATRLLIQATTHRTSGLTFKTANTVRTIGLLRLSDSRPHVIVWYSGHTAALDNRGLQRIAEVHFTKVAERMLLVECLSKWESNATGETSV